MPVKSRIDVEQDEDLKIGAKLDAIATRLDVIISLLLDLLPDEAFAQPRKVSHKVHRLNLTRVKLRDSDIGKVVGSPSKDVSRRLSEYTSEDVVKRIKRRGNEPSIDSKESDFSTGS